MAEFGIIVSPSFSRASSLSNWSVLSPRNFKLENATIGELGGGESERRACIT